tara:strand:- start:2682 stop:3101 length:420 start_codon:yes stop_codon:yes gene_type:complete
VNDSSPRSDSAPGSSATDEDPLAFSCKRGTLIAVYADPAEKYRFWLAEAATPIRKGSPDQVVSVYYYIAKESGGGEGEYTQFVLEDGKRNRQQINYLHCLSTVSCITRKNDTVFITAHERDRINAIGKKQDEEDEMITK